MGQAIPKPNVTGVLIKRGIWTQMHTWEEHHEAEMEGCSKSQRTPRMASNTRGRGTPGAGPPSRPPWEVQPCPHLASRARGLRFRLPKPGLLGLIVAASGHLPRTQALLGRLPHCPLPPAHNPIQVPLLPEASTRQQLEPPSPLLQGSQVSGILVSYHPWMKTFKNPTSKCYSFLVIKT